MDRSGVVKQWQIPNEVLLLGTPTQVCVSLDSSSRLDRTPTCDLAVGLSFLTS